MQIWVDADACPKVIKEILFRVANRTQISALFIANQLIRVPPSPYLRAYQVPAGFDVADNHIVHSLAAGDLVITADIPLAAAAVEKGAHALSPRGERFTPENIKSLLSVRNFMSELRDSGVQTGGPAALSHADRQAFANQLDSLLVKLAKSR
jgi:hypothetical protein